jgi:predicted nucleic acid-binding Zn ribbon protein
VTWRPLPGAAGDEPRPLTESLDVVARSLGAPPPAALGALFARWPELVGATLAAHCRPLSLVRGVLVVAVDHTAWAAQLRWLEADVLRRLEERLGTGVVTVLEVRVRPV